MLLIVLSLLLMKIVSCILSFQLIRQVINVGSRDKGDLYFFWKYESVLV